MQKIKFLPYTISIEELSERFSTGEDTGDSYSSDMMDDLSDHGLQSEGMIGNIEYESLIIQVLHLLTDRQKIVFLFQLLRSSGFELEQDQLRRTIHLSKNNYYASLREVKDLVSKVAKYNETISQV